MDRESLLDAARDLAQVLIMVALVAMPVALLMEHVRTKQQITHTGYQIAKTTNEHRRLMEENKMLSIEAAVQGRSDRVVSLASERFGLEPARHEQILIIPVLDDAPAPRQAHASLGAER